MHFLGQFKKNKHQGREIRGKYVRKQILNTKRKTAKP